MGTDTFQTPILLIVFNRPTETKKILERLRDIKPAFLFVAQDAPREGNTKDVTMGNEVKHIIETTIDWPCTVEKLYQPKNLGCGYGPASAITWFFSKVPMGIILEDDCLADKSFFRFCAELLERYRDNKKISHISGDNYQDGNIRGKYSYYFSKYTHNWGWASWARAWTYFDHSLIPESERSHVWDAAWEKSVRKMGAYGIIPQKNLVENIGFGEQATHTKEVTSVEYHAQSLSFPLKHPKKIVWNIFADYYTYRHHFGYSPLASLLVKIKKIYTR